MDVVMDSQLLRIYEFTQPCARAHVKSLFESFKLS